jgi:ABC-2 type transport system permease protein
MGDALLLPAWSLGWREIVRFHRDRARVVSGIATALLFWVLIGFGMRGSFTPAGMPSGVGAVEYLFPGTVVFVVLVTAIVGTFSLIEDRRSGFLQGVIVAPVPRASIVLGKVLGGASIALLQGVVLLPLLGALGIPAGLPGILLGLVALFAMAFTLTCIGFVVAWGMESIQGFHGIVNLLLLPLWFLSGALFPLDGAAGPLKVLMRLDPLAYGLAAFRQALYGRADVAFADPATAWCVTMGFAAATFGAAVLVSRR